MQAEDRGEGEEIAQPESRKYDESPNESASEDFSEEEDNSDDNFQQSELKDEEEDSESLPTVREPAANTKERERLTRTRSRNKQADSKNYELRKEPNRDKQRPTEDRTERDNRQQATKKEDEKNLQVYVRIIDYLKKIEWDQQNAQNKMNPYHFMTAQCFWFVICAEYFSYNFFSKKHPEEAVAEIMDKVRRVNYPIPQRISKNTLMQLPKPYNPPFQTNALVKLSEKVSETLRETIPSIHYEYYYETTDKQQQALTQTSDDDVFRSSTRALVYNYIKDHYKQKLDGVLSAEVPQDEAKSEVEERQTLSQRQEPIVQEPFLEEEEDKEETEKKENDKHNEPTANGTRTDTQKEADPTAMEIEQPKALHPKESSKKRSLRKKRELGREQLLLSGIRHMPLDKMISVLSAQLPENRIPQIEEQFIPVSSDPFQLISQTHPLDLEFLQYLKQRRRKENLQEMAIQAQQSATKNKSNANVDPTLDDAKCQICTDGDYTEDNLIVFCSTCNISLHQRCVGLMKVPTENWVCDLCLAFGPKGRWLRCALCTVRGGALKRTTIPSDTQIFKETNPSYHQYLKGCTHSKNKQEYIPPNTEHTHQEKPLPHLHHEGKHPHTHPHSVMKPEQSEHNQIQLPIAHVEGELEEPPKQEQPKQELVTLRKPEEQQEGGESDDDKQLYYNYYNLDENAVQETPDCHFVWVHYTCAVWVPEVYFEERNGTISIKGVETIDKKRFKIMCEICQTSRTGACIKCAEEECTLNYHAECARKAGVYMEQRYIDRLQYFIYCNLHKPIKVSRVIESKNKKYKDEIIKFCRCIEKYVETYKIASVPFKLMKSNKKTGKLRKEGRNRQTREDREHENQDFMKRLKEFLLGNRKLIIQLKKTNDGYRVVDVEEPVKRSLRTNITKNDQIWEFFSYRNLSASQLFKKFKRIMKENAVLRDSFVKDIKNQSKSERKSERRQRNNANMYTVVDEDPNKPYCLCRKPYLPGELMLECEVCGEWFHFNCIGFIGTEDDGEKSEFNCYRCQRYQDPAVVEERKKKYTRFYNPNFVPIIPEEEEDVELVEASEDDDQPKDSKQIQATNKLAEIQSKQSPHARPEIATEGTIQSAVEGNGAIQTQPQIEQPTHQPAS